MSRDESANDHTLTDAEREALRSAYDDRNLFMVYLAAQELLAARLATAEAEKEALRAEVESWKHSRYHMAVRAEAAEAALAGLVAKIEALADEWGAVDAWGAKSVLSGDDAAADLRALIPADAATDEATS